MFFIKRSRTLSYESFKSLLQNLSYKYYHVYMEVWHATEGEVLETAPDMRKEVKDYDKYVVGVDKEDLLVGHIPIEISSPCFHFLTETCHLDIISCSIKVCVFNR